MFFVFVQPTLLLHIYTDNEALIKESIPSLFTMVLYYLITVPGSIFFNTVAGTGNTKSTFLIEMITAGVYLYVHIPTYKPNIHAVHHNIFSDKAQYIL